MRTLCGQLDRVEGRTETDVFRELWMGPKLMQCQSAAVGEEGSALTARPPTRPAENPVQSPECSQATSLFPSNVK